MKMYYQLCLLFLLLVAFDARAVDCTSTGLCANLIVETVHIRSETDSEGVVFARVLLDANQTITHSCSFANRELRLDIVDASKEAMFSTLLTWVSQREKIHVWFNPSPVEVQGNVCSRDQVAEITQIAVSVPASEFDADASIAIDDLPLE